MRTFELSTHVKTMSRGDGKSATAAAAYRACCVIECERENKTHDYSRKAGLEASAIVLPGKAPAWAKDRAKLWNQAERREKNGARGKNAGAYKANAAVAREFFFSFPAELSAAGRLKAATAIARHLADNHGVAADLSIHQPGKDGDERNYHCHMLTTTRRLTEAGLTEKAREWDDLKKGPALSKALRKFIADTLNAGLAEEGKAGVAHVEHRSFAERGQPQKQTQQHQGPGKTHALRKEQGQARKAWEARTRKEQRERHAKERAALKLKQDFNLERKLAELRQRGKEGLESIRRDLEAARKADIPPDGLRRVFLIVTRQDMREAFQRKTREVSRVEEANEKRLALKAELRAERNAYVRGQVEERGQLTERHAGEDRQLQEAVRHRQTFDHVAEVQARRVEGRSLTRDRQQEQERGGRSIGPELH